MPVRIVHVGLGAWGRDWAELVLPAAEGIEVVASVDRNPAARSRAIDAGLVAADSVHDDLDETLRHVDSDAVLVTVDILSHHGVVLAALAAGKHVLVEKPLASTLAQAREIVAAATRSNRLVAVGQNYRYQAPTVLAADLLRRRALGGVRGLFVDFRRYYPYNDNLTRHPEIDHSILMQVAIHHFDLMRMCLGRDPRRVHCHTWRPPGCTSISPAAVSATLEFDEGIVSTYRANMLSTGDETPWSGLWRVECDDGDLFWAGPTYRDGPSAADLLRTPGYVKLRPRGGAAVAQTLPATQSDRVLLLEEFAAATRTGADIAISARNNLASVEAMLAAIESTRTGLAIEVGARDGESVVTAISA